MASHSQNDVTRQANAFARPSIGSEESFAETDVGEADLETTINDLMSGQYSDPVRVVAFNTAEHWSEDASEDVAREIMRRLDLAGWELPSSIQAFVDSHLGPDRSLSSGRALCRGALRRSG